MKKELKKFFVITWDFNTDSINMKYDVLPYLRMCIKDRKEKWKKNQKSKRFQKNVESGLIDKETVEKYYKFPETFSEFKKFIQNEAQYQYWSRCEYEMICSGWPVQNNDYKLDVYEQIMMNLDTICEILWNEITK